MSALQAFKKAQEEFAKEKMAEEKAKLGLKANEQTAFLKITDEQLQKHWQTFTNDVKENVARTIMESILPTLTPKTIQITVTSNIHKTMIRPHLRNFLDYLRENEGVFANTLELIKNKSSKTQKNNTPKVFLPIDTLKQMITKNPKLAELTETLGLKM